MIYFLIFLYSVFGLLIKIGKFNFAETLYTNSSLSCSEIAHEKCAQKIFNFDQIHESWLCGKCSASQTLRYNPFNNIFHDTHLPDDSEAMDEINLVSQILNSCKHYDLNAIDNITSQVKTNFAFLFNNIDGAASNFDSFLAHLGQYKT